MSSSGELFEQYADAFRSGRSDPRPFLEQADAEEREELEDLIEIFLLRAEPLEWDPEGFKGSEAGRLAEHLSTEFIEPRNGWSELLPEFRLRQEKPRAEVVTELARELEAADDEQTEKVADYYHELEYGTLDPREVSGKVVESLANIYGTTVEVLRRAGSNIRPPEESGGEVFARMVSGAQSFAVQAKKISGLRRIPGKPDRIDRLFTEPDFHDPDR